MHQRKLRQNHIHFFKTVITRNHSKSAYPQQWLSYLEGRDLGSHAGHLRKPSLAKTGYLLKFGSFALSEEKKKLMPWNPAWVILGSQIT